MTLIECYLSHPRQQAQYYLCFFRIDEVLIGYGYYLIIYFHFLKHVILQFNSA
jgi:hypothetical protein